MSIGHWSLVIGITFALMVFNALRCWGDERSSQNDPLDRIRGDLGFLATLLSLLIAIVAVWAAR
jgi:hypothetical protein